MTVTLKHCGDVTEHALSLAGWQQEFDQVQEGRFSGDIVDIAGEQIRLVRESANLAISQSMQFPPHQWHLVIPIHWPNNSIYRSDTVTVLPRCEQFWSVASAHYDLMVVSVDRSRYGWLERDDQRLRTLEVPTQCLVAVRQQWQAMTNYLRMEQANLEPTPALQRVLLQQVEEGIDLLLNNDIRSLKHDEECYRTRRYIVDRCHTLTKAQAEDPPSIMTLCNQLNISRRTLQYSFQAETGQSPVHYLRALRLNAVRRSLLQEPWLGVADAAALQGFFHHSYFSREYCRLFKELPSDTRKRAHSP